MTAQVAPRQSFHQQIGANRRRSLLLVFIVALLLAVLGFAIGFGTTGTLERILLGPAHVTDGSENLVGAVRQSMAALGARTIRDMQRVEMVYAPSTQTEGKSWQRAR